MNIFYLDKCPDKAAKLQYNKHVVKMILESAQMLCTAHHHYAEKLGYDNSYIPYKKAHYNHPSTIWCRQNSRQYYWLFHHMIALGNEWSQPPQAMPDEYKHEDSIIAYWQYYINDKSHIAAKTEKKYERIPIFN